MLSKKFSSVLSVLRQHVTQRWHRKVHLSSEQMSTTIDKETRFQKALASNPYLQSKALWNDMYGDVEQRYQRSRYLNFLLVSIIALAVLGLIVMAGETKIKPFPFVLKDDQLFAIADTSTPEFTQLKEKLALHFAAQFIRSARTVSIDSGVNAQHKIAAYSFTGGGEAVQVLKDFYQSHHSDQIAQRVVIDVEDVVVLPSSSARTLTVRWKEESRDVHSGTLLKSIPYIAQLTYHYGKPPQEAEILKTNPLGFYITYLSWSSDQNS